METGNPRTHVRWNLVRSTAEDILSRFHGGQLPIDVKQIARSLGISVQEIDPNDKDLAGFFVRDPSQDRVIIGVNSTHSEVRKRFTTAHELGHFLLHDAEPIRYDRKDSGYGFGRLMRRDSESSKGENREEIEANFFAAELLMPRRLILERIGGEVGSLSFIESDTDKAIRKLAAEFKVSVQALTVRLVQLKIIEAY